MSRFAPMGTLLLGLLAASPVLAGNWPPAWSWDRVAASAFPGDLTAGYGGFFNETTMAELKDYPLVGVWGVNVSCNKGEAYYQAMYGPDPVTIGCPEYNDFVPTQHANSIYQAELLKAQNPNVTVFGYLYTSCNQVWYDFGAEYETNRTDLHTLLNRTSGQPFTCTVRQGPETSYYDWSNPAWRAWFLEKAVGPFLHTPAIDSIFFDEITLMLYGWEWMWWEVPPGYPKLYRDGVLALMAEVGDLLTPLGMIPWYSNNALYVTQPADPEQFYLRWVETLKTHGGGMFREFWQGTLNEVLDLQYLAAEGIPVQVHSGTGGETLDEATDRYMIATFLLGCGEYHYVQLGKDWNWNSWAWPAGYDHELGAPLGLATNTTAMYWTRSFANADVAVDFTNPAARNATITWR